MSARGERGRAPLPGRGGAAPSRDAPRGAGPARDIRVVLPEHLRTLAGATGEIVLEVDARATLGALLAALETRHPVLGGTIVDRASGRRRALVRFFAERRDLSHQPMEAVLPASVRSGSEPFVVVGAMAGG